MFVSFLDWRGIGIERWEGFQRNAVDGQTTTEVGWWRAPVVRVTGAIRGAFETPIKKPPTAKMLWRKRRDEKEGGHYFFHHILLH